MWPVSAVCVHQGVSRDAKLWANDDNREGFTMKQKLIDLAIDVLKDLAVELLLRLIDWAMALPHGCF